ncbi:MAG: tripartite tricarboxylate transporter substrate binding protein [Xanthobacteraceae bacterium]
MFTRRSLIAFSAASAVAPKLAIETARAATWPDRPAHMIVPLAAGGPTDSVARVLGEQLSQLWGQQCVIENKPGGGTNLANAYVAHADPDGYTILYGTSSLAVNSSLYRTLDYDPFTDLAPISMVAKFPFFMFVPNSSPARTVAGFITYAKEHAGKLIMGSPGTGSAPHLAAELFMQMAGLQMTHVPYRGAAPAFIDLIPGRIDCYFGSGELLTYSRSSQAHCLATTGKQRSSAAPEIPTVNESGLPNYFVDSWQGVFLPGKTPQDIVQKFNGDAVKVLAKPAVIDLLAQTAYTATSSTPDELRTFLKEDSAKWNAVVKQAGIKVE